MTRIGEFIFPEVFLTGELDTDDERALCAYALHGWALCFSGAKPPSINFGIAMAKIGSILGIIPTNENIKKYAIDKGFLSE